MKLDQIRSAPDQDLVTFGLPNRLVPQPEEKAQSGPVLKLILGSAFVFVNAQGRFQTQNPDFEVAGAWVGNDGPSPYVDAKKASKKATKSAPVSDSGMPSMDGWTPWDTNGFQPRPSEKCWVRMRDGSILMGNSVGTWGPYTYREREVIAYRPYVDHLDVGAYVEITHTGSNVGGVKALVGKRRFIHKQAKMRQKFGIAEPGATGIDYCWWFTEEEISLIQQ